MGHDARNELPDQADDSSFDRAADLATAILAGSFDKGLSLLVKAIESRRASLARLRRQRAADRIVVHGRVRVSNLAKPQYLRGLVGEVHEFDGEDVVVCLDRPVGRFTSGHIQCSPELLEPIDGT